MKLPDVTEQQGRAIIGGVALTATSVIATVAWGRNATLTILGVCVLWLLWNRAAILERLGNLEIEVVGMLPEEIDDLEAAAGWPAEEPNPVEGPITEPIPVQPRTEPMRLGDEIEADLRAHVVREAEQRPTPHKRMVEKTFGDVTLRIMEETP